MPNTASLIPLALIKGIRFPYLDDALHLLIQTTIYGLEYPFKGKAT